MDRSTFVQMFLIEEGGLLPQTNEAIEQLIQFCTLAAIRAEPFDVRSFNTIIISLIKNLISTQGNSGNDNNEVVPIYAEMLMERVNENRAVNEGLNIDQDERSVILSAINTFRMQFDQVAEMSDENTCAICLIPTNKPTHLPDMDAAALYTCRVCKCVLHEECVNQWYAIKRACPNCRLVLVM